MQKEIGKYTRINLFLDRDNSGIKATKKAIISDFKFKDRSILNKGFKDLNDKLIGKEMMIKELRGLRHPF
ncbi:MAG: hypothetical protein ABI691_17720 [Ginsengibacter sp.]